MSDWYLERLGLGGNDPATEPSRYMPAEICLNGHVTTDDLESSPQRAAKFCSSCGAATIRACSKCDSPIRGCYYIPGLVGAQNYSAPNHCFNCGMAFPWTQARIQAAKEYAAELEGLNAQELEQLSATIDDLTTSGPRTELAVTRFKRFMAKAGQAVGSGLYKIVVDVASEAAKKALIGA